MEKWSEFICDNIYQFQYLTLCVNILISGMNASKWQYPDRYFKNSLGSIHCITYLRDAERCATISKAIVTAYIN